MFSLICLTVVVLGLLVGSARANPNGLGLYPPMGWNTWCTGSSCHQLNSAGTGDKYNHNLHDVCNEGMVKEIAEVMIENGMRDLGYNYINLDDCWAYTERDQNGNIQPDLSRFPSGMPEIIDWLHARGFHFGLYTSAGPQTCSPGGRPLPIPGSYDHYTADAKTFASWGVDYVKFDWCDAKGLDQDTQTTQMAHAMNLTGRPMWFNFHCGHPPQTWCQNAGNSFRIGPDHHDNWPSTSGIIELLATLGHSSKPFAWNDPDFLMTGGAGCDKWWPKGTRCPGQTDDEYITEYLIWSVTNAPLLVSTDLRNMTALMRSLLLNAELISVNQDPLLQPGVRLGYADSDQQCQIWGKPIVGGYAVVLYNAGKSVVESVELDFKVLSRYGQGFPGINETATVLVRDLLEHKDLSTVKGRFVYHPQIPSHGSRAFKLLSNV